MIKNKLKMNKGYSLLETIFYISFFAIFSILVINSLIVMTKSFRETTIYADLMQGSSVMEKISREVRQAVSINSISTSILKINTKDAAGLDKIEEFTFSNPNVRFLENNVFTGNLNTSNISIQDLTFTKISTVKGEAVKILLTVKSNRDSRNRTESFYDTVVLRGNY